MNRGPGPRFLFVFKTILIARTAQRNVTQVTAPSSVPVLFYS